MILKHIFFTSSLVFIFIGSFTSFSQEKKIDAIFTNTNNYKIKYSSTNIFPLFLLDEKRISKKEFDLLLPKSIQNIIILKGANAIKNMVKKEKMV